MHITHNPLHRHSHARFFLDWWDLCVAAGSEGDVRCGGAEELSCTEHWNSDRHDCSYDYKAAEKEAIARENPVVKAAKIIQKWKIKDLGLD
ncbi:hypothetical protein RJ639_006304 [Escallonia herrerae]|uniref:Uncharacterized protein n=1 Tax=Escallonia herrerae TaxID=1293975 RepID=A0AA88VXE7_9ASTE|nr:hypothetical protein RJ639_006304 [Escallonia herrerae]